MPPDEMPEEVLDAMRKPDLRSNISLFVFAPTLEAAGTARFWRCAAIMVWRGKLARNRVIVGLTRDQGGDTEQSVGGEYAEHITAIIDAGLSDIRGKEVTDE